MSDEPGPAMQAIAAFTEFQEKFSQLLDENTELKEKLKQESDEVQNLRQENIALQNESANLRQVVSDLIQRDNKFRLDVVQHAKDLVAFVDPASFLQNHENAIRRAQTDADAGPADNRMQE